MGPESASDCRRLGRKYDGRESKDRHRALEHVGSAHGFCENLQGFFKKLSRKGKVRLAGPPPKKIKGKPGPAPLCCST
jgi:hypothetical protein